MQVHFYLYSHTSDACDVCCCLWSSQTVTCISGKANCMSGTATCMGGTATCMGGTATCMGGTATCMGGTATCMGGTATYRGGTATYMDGTATCMSVRFCVIHIKSHQSKHTLICQDIFACYNLLLAYNQRRSVVSNSYTSFLSEIQ